MGKREKLGAEYFIPYSILAFIMFSAFMLGSGLLSISVYAYYSERDVMVIPAFLGIFFLSFYWNGRAACSRLKDKDFKARVRKYRDYKGMNFDELINTITDMENVSIIKDSGSYDANFKPTLGQKRQRVVSVLEDDIIAEITEKKGKVSLVELQYNKKPKN